MRSKYKEHINLALSNKTIVTKVNKSNKTRLKEQSKTTFVAIEWAKSPDQV